MKTKTFLEIVRDVCNKTIDDYNKSVIDTFDDMRLFQDTLESFIKTIGDAYIKSPAFSDGEYVACLEVIYETKDKIYNLYFKRYE